MGEATYVELHVHSCYSFSDGASSPEELVEEALRLGYRALALTDHNGLYGSMAFARYAEARGLFPITGAEVTLADGSHLTLLAASRRGYGHLCRLLSAAHLHSPRGEPRLAEEVLWRFADGLICLTGCRQGRLAQLVDRGETEAAKAWLRQLQDAFGPDGVYVELQHHFVRGDKERIARLRQLARSVGLPVVATNNVHYHRRDRHRLHDVLVAIRHRTTLDESHRLRRPNSEFYLKSPQEMEALFADCPEALRNTLIIAERCRDFDLNRDLGYTFPDFVSTSRLDAAEPDARTTAPADAELARLCRCLLDERYPLGSALRAEAEARLEEELRLIRKHRLSGFFLVYRDLLELAREVAAELRAGKTEGRRNLPPGRGRGSSVSSLVCYLIGLSHVDPLRAGLFLGRFLNDELRTVPDIDLDFPRDIRDRLIQRVYERYGRERAALVCSFSTYRFRSALRDIGRALGIPPAQIDKLSRLSEGGRAGTARQELERIPELARRLDEPPWNHVIALAEAMDGFPRHVMQHVGGMVISSRPLVELVPVEQGGIPGRTICQWDKDSCDDAGFIKVDFLALGALGQVEECLDLIAAGGKGSVDLATIDYDDENVYRMIQEGDTIGVFQIESRAQIQMLPRTRPENLDDLAVQIAIVRPGPIVGGAVNPYVRRREQQRRNPRYRPPYDHPVLESVLADTLGVILYQDQVIQVCQVMAGFSAGQADGLRRAMSRRRAEMVMESYWPAFRDGARERGIPEETARKVFLQVMAFSEFGFPKSHSAAFAVLAYQTAWLRRYYLPEFTAALFNNQPMGFYPLDVLVKDAQRHGLEIRPPCINRSGVMCTVEGNAVRIGLSFVKQVGRFAEVIVQERERGGPYRTLRDFLERVDVPRAVAEHLIRVGAMDVFGLGERRLLWQLGLLQPDGGGEAPAGAGSRARENRLPGKQLSLPLEWGAYEVPLPEATDWDRMVADYGLMNLSTRFHPIGLLRPRLDRALVKIEALRTWQDGATVAVSGLVVARQRPETARGFVFLLIEDETGLLNVVIKPDLYEACRDVIRSDPLLTVRGRVQNRDGNVNVLAEAVEPLRVRPASPEPLQTRRRRRGMGGRGRWAAGKNGLGERAVAASWSNAPALPPEPVPRSWDAVDQARLVAPPAHNFH